MSCKVKSHLICLFGRASNAAGTAASGLIAALDHAFEVEIVQQNATDQRMKSAEGVPPMIFPGNEPKQQIGQQSRPDLPADGVLVAAHEIRQLKRLFELFEEHLLCKSQGAEPCILRFFLSLC